MKKRMLCVALVTSMLAGSLTGCGNKVAELPTEVQDSDIYVEKVEDLSEDFIMGADVSSYLAIKESGVKFYDFDGEEVDDAGFFTLLHDSGVNCIRIRVWNDPYDEDGNGYGGGNCDLNNAIEIGKLATEAGMSVQIDFHYSDFWADPNKQMVPKAWADMTLEEKADSLEDYTYDSLQKLLDEGVNVSMVQLGNETTGGLAGETGMGNMCTLFSAGAKAVRAVSEKNKQDILIAIHFADPQNGHYEDYAKSLEANEVDYDVFASSYYPYWHGTIAKLCEILDNIATTYGKKVYVTETSWAYTLEDGDGNGNTVSEESNSTDMPYDFTVQGQATAIALLVKGLAALGDECIGVNYWEPAWLGGEYAYDENGNLVDSIYEKNQESWEKYGSGWASSYAAEYDPEDAGQYYGGSAVDNQAWFDFTGHPLESLKTYLFCRTGTTAEEPEELWHEVEEAAVQTEGNFLTNGSFEDELNDWDVSGFDTTDAASNAHAGEGSMHFWSEKGGDTYTATQTLTLDAGTYKLTGYVEGGDAGSDDKFGIGVQMADGTESMDWGSVSGWKSWDELTVDDIVIPEDGTEITVVVTATLSKGCWGAFDDLVLEAK